MRSSAAAAVSSWAVLLALCCLLPCAESQACPNDWVYFNGSCYVIGTQQLQWADAEQICRLFDSDLAVLETPKENEFMKRILSEHHATTQVWNAQVWIGATDVFQEGHFMWLDTFQPLTFQDWSSGEPNAGHGNNSEDCVQMRRSHGWQWNDEMCQRKCFFACEMKVTGGGIIG